MLQPPILLGFNSKLSLITLNVAAIYTENPIFLKVVNAINAKVVIIIIRLNIALTRGLQRFVGQALQLYLEGLSFRSIGRILGFSNVSILNWIRAFGKKLDALRSEKSVSVVEIDEMHSAIGNKKNDCWIWIAVDRNRHKFINCVTRKRNTKMGKRLWE